MPLPAIEVVPDDILRQERATSLNRLCNLRDWEPGRGLSLIMHELNEHPIVHRKSWEYAICIDGLTKLECVTPTARALSVGAGFEKPIYYFANKIQMMVATDLYNNPTGEGRPQMLVNPAAFAQFPYRADHLQTMQMSGDDLKFPDASFDFIFCLSSIEHFGGGSRDVIRKAFGEMIRVLRPQGTVCIITELTLNAGHHRECFTLEELEDIFVDFPGIDLVGGKLDLRIQKSLMDYPVDLSRRDTAAISPHIVLNAGGCILTSCSMFFRKQ